MNRMTVAVDPQGFDIGYTYYKDGQRKSMVDPDSGRFTYTYDSIGRLETILNPFGEKTTLAYDIANRRIGQKLANGVITSLSYDDANRLDEVISRNSSAVLLSSFNYLLDPAGNRTTLTASGSDGFLWSYDKTNQLLTERRTLSADTYAHTYTYDPRGNRLTLSDSTDTLTYTCDDANRLETVTDSSGTTTYAYDAKGNQLTIEEPSGDITTNTWNGENRLVLVEHPDSTETAYRYNGDGLRVAEDHDGTVTLFLYDGNNRLQETDETGLVEAEFTYIPLPYAEVLSQHRDMESSFYLCDGIRNIRQLTDDTQTITDEYSFDAFGNLRSSTGSSANSQLYKGHLLSYRNDPHAGPDTETSTHFRNQSAQTGRFTSEDPAADDHNLYRLVGNNPVNKEDPSGLEEDPGRQKLFREIIERMEDDRHGFTAVQMQRALIVLYKSAYTTPTSRAQKAIDAVSSTSVIDQYWYIVTLQSLDYHEKFAANEAAFRHYQLDVDSGYSRLLGRRMPEWAQSWDMVRGQFYKESREQLSKDVDALLTTLDLVTFVGSIAKAELTALKLAKAEAQAERIASTRAAEEARAAAQASQATRAASEAADAANAAMRSAETAARSPVLAHSIELYPESVFPRSASGNIQAIAETGKFVEAIPSHGYHGISGVTVEEIVEHGVAGGGTNINIAAHVGGAEDSAFCGLAPMPGRGGGAAQLTPVEFAREGGFVLEVDGVPGFPTDLHAPKAISRLPKGEAEIATPRRIPTERIKRIGKVTVDDFGREVVQLKDWIRNPNYKPLD